MKRAVERSHLSPLGLLFVCFVTTIGLTPSPIVSAQTLPTPPDQGLPSGRQRGGASRGNCLDYQNLTALVPVVDGRIWSQTHSLAPEFFFYLPEALTTDIPLELVVQDRNDNYVVRQQFSIDAPPGILVIPTASTLSAPSASTEMIPNEFYSWTFSIYCDATRPSASVSVFGSIQPVADIGLMMDADKSLTPTMQFDLARQYAEANLWHEALGLTLSLYPTEGDSQAYLETLAVLLDGIGLADIPPSVSVFQALMGEGPMNGELMNGEPMNEEPINEEPINEVTE